MGPIALFIICFFHFAGKESDIIYLPVQVPDRQNLSSLKLTGIGTFGIVRKERPGIPAHLHTGIDIQRPSDNYHDEPVFPVSPGTVVSKRTDGPYAQVIIEHAGKDGLYWTVYEHVSGVTVNPGSRVNPKIPIARFMNKKELDKYGWQFNHLHFEVLKLKPEPVKPSSRNPGRLFKTYSLNCFTQEDLSRYYFDPLNFFRDSFSRD